MNLREHSPRVPAKTLRLLYFLLAGIGLAALPASATDAGTIARSGSLQELPKPVKVLTLASPAEVSTRKFPGYLKARYNTPISFRVSGPLIELPALKGAVVSEGDLLARIDPRDFISSLASLDADVKVAQENLKGLEQARPEDITSARAAVTAAEATYENDKVNLERMQNLYDSKVVPKVDLDQATAKTDVSASALEQARQDLQKATLGAREEDIQAAKATLESLEAKRKSVDDSLKDTELRAPYNGVVAERYVENHQYVNAKETILDLQDLSTFEVVINVPEQILINRRRGNIISHVTATAQFDSLPGKNFPLEFKEFSTRVDERVQTFAATFILTATGDAYTFLPGMTTTVEIQFHLDDSGNEATFVFPVGAVVSDAGGSNHVWRLAETERNGVYKTQKTEVTIGDFSGVGVAITSGVKSGEKFAVTGGANLQEGMLVSGLEWEGN